MAGLAVTLQDLQIRRVSPERITVALPAFKHPRDGAMRTAVVLPDRVVRSVRKSVAATFNASERPMLDSDSKRGLTSLATH